jgi:hypothetical protein
MADNRPHIDWEDASKDAMVGSLASNPNASFRHDPQLGTAVPNIHLERTG